MTQYNVQIVVDPNRAKRGADQAKKSIKSVGDQAERTSGTIRSAFASLGLALVAQQVLQLADAYTTLQNRLRVTGAENEALVATTNDLFNIATRTKQPVEALVALYQKGTIASKELGASQAELLEFTETVGNALRIQGGSSAAASGALLQLSQSLGSGIVRAEEFNSILEGAFPIALAAARGLDEAGGSVAKLRQLIVAGKVDSQSFFQAILSQSDALKAQLGSAVLTVGQAFTVLNNNLVQYIGQLNTSSGVTQALASVIELLGNNLETLGNVAQTAAIVIGGALAAQAISAAIAGMTALTAIIAANPFGALALAIGTAIAALIAFSDQLNLADTGLGDFLDSLFALGDTAVSIFSDLVQAITGVAPEFDVLVDAVNAFGTIATNVILGIVAVFDVLIAATRAAGAALSDPFNAGSAAAAAFSGSIGTVIGRFQDSQRAREAARSAAASASGDVVRANNTEVESIQRITKEEARRLALLQEIKGPIEEAKIRLADLEALYAAGSITLAQYNAEKAKLTKTITSTTAATGAAVATFQSETDKLREANALLQVQGTTRESLNNIISIQDALKRQLTEAEKAEVIALTETNAQLERQAQILQSIKGPPQEARDNLAALEALYKSGQISLEEYNKAYNKFALDLANFGTTAGAGVEQYFLNLEATALSSADVMRQSFEAVSDSMATALEDFANTGKLSFKSLADDILKQINRIAAQAASQQIMQLLGGFGSSLFGGSSFGSIGGSSITSLLGFDSGGTFSVGGIGGIDNNVLSMNGSPIARVSRGEKINVESKGTKQTPTQIIMNISTPNADSFRRSQDQILSRTSGALNRAQRRNG